MTHHFGRPTALLFLVSHLALGCSSDDTETGEQAHTQTDATDDAADASDAVSDGIDDTGEPDTLGPLECEQGVAVTSVTGTAVDDSDAPVTDGRGQVCIRSAPEGRLTCLRPEPTDESGSFFVEVPREVGCFESVVMRVFSVGGELSSIYCPVSLDQVDAATQTLQLGSELTLWPIDEPLERDVVASPDDYGFITFDGGLRVRVKPSALLDGDEVYEELRGRRYAPDEIDTCFVPEDAELFDLWAFGPETDVTGEIFALEVPNTYGLQPGDTVSIWLLGGIGTTLGRAGFVDEGEFRRVSRGQVSEDGTTIVSQGGVAAFTWLGIGPDPEQ